MGIEELLMQCGHVAVRFEERDNSAGGRGSCHGVEDRVAFLLQDGNEARALAQQLRGDLIHTELEDQFHRCVEPYQAQQVVSAGLEFWRILAEDDLFLGDEIWAADIVPAVKRRVELVLDCSSNV